MGFLPDKYEVPSDKDKYMKFVQGANKFRVLVEPLLGWEWWVVKDEDGSKMPLRASMDSDEVQNVPAGYHIDGDGGAKHFWALKVWNYELEKVQVLSITQVGIQEAIKDLNANPDWGNPLEYDITITRKGEGLETNYGVQPSPKKALLKKIEAEANEVEVNLEALFESGDPFSTIEREAEAVMKDEPVPEEEGGEKEEGDKDGKKLPF